MSLAALAASQQQAKRPARTCHTQLDKYLYLRGTTRDNILKFRKAIEAFEPGLAKMAANVLAVSIFDVGVERISPLQVKLALTSDVD